jgi:hypothetical protein
MASMINDFNFASRKTGKKFNFKTTIVRDGIEIARPAPKIPRTSRDSCFKVARSKARSAIRNHKDQVDENPEPEEEEKEEEKAKPSIIDYLEYCSYVIEYNGSCELSYAQYCAYYAPQVTITYAPPYFPPKVSADTAGSHWPRWGVVKTYAQLLA